jgi:hypothetical protein
MLFRLVSGWERWSHFIIHDDLFQKIVTFFLIRSRVVGKDVWAFVLMLIHQFLMYPPGTHFMELKVIMHHWTGRPNNIKLFCSFVNCHPSVLKNQFPSFFLILCSYGQGWMILVFHMSLLPFLNISVHSYTAAEERSLSPYWTHMHWWVFPPYSHKESTTDHLPSFYCNLHFIPPLTLTARSASLSCQLVTPLLPLFSFLLQYSSAQTLRFPHIVFVGICFSFGLWHL